MSWNEAAAIPLVYSTVYGALVEAGKLPFNPSTNERGTRSVLILGGSSGTGNVAIQLAKKMGLRVVTSCSGRNVEFVKGQGADEVRPSRLIGGSRGISKLTYRSLIIEPRMSSKEP
jgi:NADPH:quinone reductase-like Zn-dependent oxidoreductase